MPYIIPLNTFYPRPDFNFDFGILSQRANTCEMTLKELFVAAYGSSLYEETQHLQRILFLDKLNEEYWKIFQIFQINIEVLP